MKRNFEIKGIQFSVGNYTPRHNYFERGLKYRLFVGGIPTEYVFETIKRAKRFAEVNYYIWL